MIYIFINLESTQPGFGLYVEVTGAISAGIYGII